MLNPLFSPSHIRDLFPILRDTAHELRDVLHELAKQGKEEIDMSKYLSRAGLAFIARAGLGHSFGSLEESNEYEKAVKLMM